MRQKCALYFTNFDNGQPGGWKMIDADGDGHNWVYESESETVARSGKGCFLSASYYSYDGALKPDNWLVSPQLSLGGTLRVWLKGQDDDDYKEHFAIYLSTDGNVVGGNNRPLSSLIPLVAESETTSEYQEYVADLSAYDNQNGYIAIRHFNCTDQFLIVLDDFGIYASNPWQTVDEGSPTGTALFGLAPNTNYEYQVVYRVGGKDYYSPIYTLTTADDNTPPTDLSITGITANKANISWMGNADSYNLRYGKNSGRATVRLSVPEDFWTDGSGYQMHGVHIYHYGKQLRQ